MDRRARPYAAINDRLVRGPTVNSLAAWGLLGTPAPVGWGTWLARSLPADAEAGGGLMVATIQFAITLGASVGGIVFDSQGYRATFRRSAGVLVIGALLAFLAGTRSSLVSRLRLPMSTGGSRSPAELSHQLR
jgi:predicted MFS family arabinose efflux permease